MFTSPARAYRVTGWPIAAPDSWLRSAILLRCRGRCPAHSTSATRRVASRRHLWRLSPDRPAGAGQDGGAVMEHAKVNGVELAYEVVGSGEAVLLVHGAHLADALQPPVAEPALARFQRIRYHRRG